MKRTIALLLALMMCLSLCGCGDNSKSNNSNITEENNYIDDYEASSEDSLAGLWFRHTIEDGNRNDYSFWVLTVDGQLFDLPVDAFVTFIKDNNYSIDELIYWINNDWINNMIEEYGLDDDDSWWSYEVIDNEFRYCSDGKFNDDEYFTLDYSPSLLSSESEMLSTYVRKLSPESVLPQDIEGAWQGATRGHVTKAITLRNDLSCIYEGRNGSWNYNGNKINIKTVLDNHSYYYFLVDKNVMLLYSGYDFYKDYGSVLYCYERYN